MWNRENLNDPCKLLLVVLSSLSGFSAGRRMREKTDKDILNELLFYHFERDLEINKLFAFILASKVLSICRYLEITKRNWPKEIQHILLGCMKLNSFIKIRDVINRLIRFWRMSCCVMIKELILFDLLSWQEWTIVIIEMETKNVFNYPLLKCLRIFFIHPWRQSFITDKYLRVNFPMWDYFQTSS